MTSINTVKLNELKEYAAANRGPGTYTIATERADNTNTIGNSLRSAFGTNETRKLDNRTTDIIDNPGPDHYLHKSILELKNNNYESAIFKAKGHELNVNASVKYPGPTSYNS